LELKKKAVQKKKEPSANQLTTVARNVAQVNERKPGPPSWFVSREVSFSNWERNVLEWLGLSV
jgi:hypothetical protein